MVRLIGKSKSKGFTLVEMLTAIVLMAILAVSLYAGVRGVLRLNDDTANLLRQHSVTRRLVEALDRDLMNAPSCGSLLFDSLSSELTVVTLQATDAHVTPQPMSTVFVHYSVFSRSEWSFGVRRILVHPSGPCDTSLFEFPDGLLPALGLAEGQANSAVSQELSLRVMKLANDSELANAVFLRSFLVRSGE